ncbi:short-chain dehydrogenase TIC 32, chloroplastic-like isoform X3 [Cicer arietinum]|uniref:Short-chain dehydrogenase TIC 32, chloroplastic-like isoform X3 n=1 Tax=Cicer arietinum TaxID=3827 RepID=A0A3Q7Y6X4_CICAR|nr:short-chain dehydrogenase TIC 32, chloroplastic-like isoform X3 [Cicer arietinum]
MISSVNLFPIFILLQSKTSNKQPGKFDATTRIGAETAKVLAKRGVRVVVSARDLKKGCEVREKIQKESPNAEIILLEIYLSYLASLQRFCSEFLALELPHNILINNAGVYSQNIEFPEEKIEMTFATNYLASILKFEGHNIPLEEELILKICQLRPCRLL